MIEKIYKNKYMAICDNCGEKQECDSWAEVIDFMNEEGWKKKLFDGEWKHFALSAGRSKNHDTQSEIHTQRQESCAYKPC